MEFRERLTSLLADVEGSMGTALVGLDGIPVEHLSRELDMVNLGAEYAAIIGDAKKASQDLNLGDLKTLSILTQQMSLLFSLLQHGYFIALTVQNRGNWGKTRFRLQHHSERLEGEI
jgi:predicted regulator of Ras-like GTPase activity (Roadblock/LC7/MglB family)